MVDYVMPNVADFSRNSVPYFSVSRSYLARSFEMAWATAVALDLLGEFDIINRLLIFEIYLLTDLKI